MKFRLLCAPLLLVLTFTAAAADPKDNQIENVRRVPPLGVKVSEKDRAELQAGLASLATQMQVLREQLRTQPKLLELLPDVEIFHKAVRVALTYDEFSKSNEIATARALLKTGYERALALKQGRTPWLTTNGLVVRGFTSKIDGSVQPYGVVLPEACPGCAPFRLDIWFHGRGETLSELNFIAGRQKDPGQFTPAKTIVLHVYNRFCNPARFAGETDVFEALDHVKKWQPVDEDRILVRGFSMGGASCWDFATHHAWRWAAANPGAGFSETADFLKVFQSEDLKPQPWEQKLWRLYDATDYAINIFNVPTVAYSGEDDKQKQAADMMEKAMAAEGLKLTHIIGPKTGHKYEPNAKKQVEELVDAAAAKGRNPVPTQVKFTTFTLRYNKMAWVEVDGLEEHWERGRVDAELNKDGNSIKATTKGVTAVTFAFDAGKYPLDPKKPATILIDGQKLSAPGATGAFAAHFRKENGKWQAVQLPASSNPGPALAKRHGLQGPIDDAFMDSFMFVRPTSAALNPKVGAWVRGEMQHAITHWRQQFRGDARVKDDSVVTDADIAAHNLVLWGDPQSNKLLARIADKLPVKWGANGLVVAGKTYDAGSHVPVLIYPNPLNPRRYVVINSSFTYREYDYLNNARQTPKLPDWAVVDISKPVTSRFPGDIAAAGFFGEKWDVK
ncbi:MAG: prolyl oligopeptidase family serine peptidase [Verrucomicrobia bacterium]|nr:prolyl oligopeptidase family serine peptidase [Verrucomicrobiota bacterium]